jgi:hypothetical protein
MRWKSDRDSNLYGMSASFFISQILRQSYHLGKLLSPQTNGFTA